VKRCAGADVQVLPTRTDCEAPTDAFSCSTRSNDHHFSDSTKQSGSSATLKAQICDRLSEILGIRIYRIVKITGSNPIYRMELEGAKIEFPRVSKLVTQVSLRYAIAGAVNKLFRPQKPNTWEKIAQMMLDAVIEQDGGQELELEGAARMYVSQYLSEVPVIHSIEGQTQLTKAHALRRTDRRLLKRSTNLRK
jgi:hypothetical protein